MLSKRVSTLVLALAIAGSSIFVYPQNVQAVQVQKQYINHNRSYEKLSPIGIVIHDTDEPGGTAQNNRDYFNSKYVDSSAHYFVDWNRAIQTIPEDEVAWHAGPTANHKYLSVEMCVPYANNQTEFNQVYNNTVQLVASICKRYGWNYTDIFSHDWISRTYKETDHTDPIGYLQQYGKTWSELINDIQKAISGQTSTDNTSNNSQGNNTQVSSGSISELQEALNNGGYGHLIVDNIAGKATLNACPLLKVGSRGDIVKWVQKKLGISADGDFGEATKTAVSNFQKQNGMESDGIIGKMTWSKLLTLQFTNSNTSSDTSNNNQNNSTQPIVSGESISELQEALNNGGYGHLVVNNIAGADTLNACPLLQVGAHGDVVKWIQKKLGVAADGEFGVATKKVVSDFQRENGLESDGVVGKMTWSKLLTVQSTSNNTSSNTSSNNQSNNTEPVSSGAISELQEALNNGGYGHLAIDNIAGSATLNACPLIKVGSHGDVVKWVQKKLGISADGEFGDATKTAVSNFQRNHSLDSDGVIGQMTWRKLLGL